MSELQSRDTSRHGNSEKEKAASDDRVTPSVHADGITLDDRQLVRIDTAHARMHECSRSLLESRPTQTRRTYDRVPPTSAIPAQDITRLSHQRAYYPASHGTPAIRSFHAARSLPPRSSGPRSRCPEISPGAAYQNDWGVLTTPFYTHTLPRNLSSSCQPL